MSDPFRLQLLKQIGSADELSVLRSLRDQVQERMVALLPERGVEQFYVEMNEVHDAFIKRVIVLAEADMARRGKGSPPVPYAYLLFGSGGREEQTLSSDQDSGIVYEDPRNDEDAVRCRDYFNDLALWIVESLQKIGYPPCDGNVLSSNADWRLSLSEWKERLNGWFEEPAWESVRYLLIVADGRCLYGKQELVKGLKDHFYSDYINTPVIVKRMLDNTLRHKVLLGVFGHLLKEQYGEDAGSLDIKYGAYIPMVNSIRLLAIQANLKMTSTLERIKGLHAEAQLSDEEAEELSEAFRLFLKLRLMTTEKTENGLYSNNGKLSGRKLTKELADELKSGLKLGKKLQRRVYRQTVSRL
ncbi:DUF294 nucleotidyltransferase-like domain-containing protein [Paenibacillus beijingensis]|uniref:Signal transduction protein n=1 Tax=Paenibacillus beijingensis TaxID=1126833 RepID=A0A0D5NEM2_9BACL|nr:DUF294 nucleotidyltransferase-like domain-containing protein [Paenibacillus beijingensis]AJY73368.1 hypothetical protein VN24_00410 [Paenibacillus beijingensis]